MGYRKPPEESILRTRERWVLSKAANKSCNTRAKSWLLDLELSKLTKGAHNSAYKIVNAQISKLNTKVYLITLYTN